MRKEGFGARLRLLNKCVWRCQHLLILLVLNIEMRLEHKFTIISIWFQSLKWFFWNVTTYPHLNWQDTFYYCCSVAKTHLTPCDPWNVAHQAFLSFGFSRKEYWSGLPFPSPGDLPDPGIKPTSPALAGRFLPLSHQGKPSFYYSLPCLSHFL